MRTPAPTQIQKRSHSPRRGRSRTGPRAHTVRPYGACSAGANPGDWAPARVAPTAKTGAFSKDGGRGKPLPYERNARFRVCAGEPLGAPAEMWAAFQEPTLIRLACARHLPPCRGKACGRPQGPPLRLETDRACWFGKLRRRNGAALALIFRKARAQWPGGNLGTHSDFARRKCSA